MWGLQPTAFYKLTKLIQQNKSVELRDIYVEFLKLGARPYISGIESVVLEYLMECDMLEEFELALKHSVEDIRGISMFMAIVMNKYDFVEVLLKYIEDINAPIHDGFTPMQLALRKHACHPIDDILELLRGSTPNPGANE